MSASIDRAHRILEEVFGYAEFRHGQEDIVRAVLLGRDVVGVLPTGGGKSICFQIPALMFPGLTLVVSPLVALMKDQTERLHLRGVQARAIHSGMPSSEIDLVLLDAQRGNIKLLYVAPERLESKSFRNKLRSIPLSLLTIDEAHCISEWGHDFRPSYQAITRLFEDRPRVPILALTATATPDVRADIISSLALNSPIEIVRGFDRPNLGFSVVHTAGKIEWLTNHARTHVGDSMIIYCGSRRRSESISEELRARGVMCEAYHAGLVPSKRSDIQDRFLEGRTAILAATNAFGMGIDKANVRHVVHADLTLTLEAYYQEAGRAGRDGAPATCTLLFQTEDRRLMDFYISGTYPEKKQIQDVYTYLCDRAELLEGQIAEAPILADATSVAVALHLAGPVVNGVLNVLERSGLIVRTSPHGSARIQLRTSPERFVQLVEQAPPEHRRVMELLSRVMRGGNQGITFDVPILELLRREAITPNEFATVMRILQNIRVVRYLPPQTGGGILISSARCSRDRLPIDMERIHRRREHAIRKLDVMVTYASTPQCKRNFIVSYFGDVTTGGTCGRCSSCRKAVHQPKVSDRAMAIVNGLISASWQVQGAFGRHVLVDILTGSRSPRITERSLDRCDVWGQFHGRSRGEILEAIDQALENGWLVRSASLYPTIGVTSKGKSIAGNLPSPLQYIRSDQANEGSSSEILRALFSMRARIAERVSVPVSSLVSDEELKSLALDEPTDASKLVAGKHGSELFLAQYGNELISTLLDLRLKPELRPAPKHVVDDEVREVVAQIRPGWTLRQVAHSVRMTPPAAAHAIQRGVEAGMEVRREQLVDDDLYAEVLEYIRYHRFAKLRHLREHLDKDVDLAELRVAIAFARRDLFSEEVS